MPLYNPASSSSSTIANNTQADGATPIIFEGATADGFETTLTVTDPTADRTLTIGNEDCNLSQQVAKVWARLDSSGSGTLTDSFNVSSLTRNAAGDVTLSFSTSFANGSYAPTGIAGDTANTGPRHVWFGSTTAFNVGSHRFYCGDSAGPADLVRVTMIIFGDR